MDPARNPTSLAWRICFAIFCVLLISPLWLTHYLPLVDAPQHASQIAIGVNWSDPAAAYPSYYFFNWRTHQILGYLLAYVLAVPFGVLTAMKILLSVALIGVPLASYRILRASDGDPWWVFYCFPIAYGFCFYWGFFHYLLTIPLGLLLIAEALRFSRAPTPRLAIWMGVLALLIFLTHVLVLVYAGLIAAVIVAFATPGIRPRILGLGALAAVVPIVAAWWLISSAESPPGESLWQLGFHRFTRVTSYLLGEKPRYPAMAAGALFLALPFLGGARPSRVIWRWIPLAVAVLFFFLLPVQMLGTWFVFMRYSVFFVPMLLLALVPNRSTPQVMRKATLVPPLLWMLLVAFRFASFDAEARPVAELLEQVEPGKRVLMLSDNPASEATTWYPYLHFGMWYQAEGRGVGDFSFATFFANRFRYQPGAAPPLNNAVEWEPFSFNWQRNGGAWFDYFLIQNTRGDWDPLANVPLELEVIGRAGAWSLVKQTRPAHERAAGLLGERPPADVD